MVKVTLEQAMKAYRGIEVYLYSLFNIGTIRGVLNATPWQFYPGK
jgi:hypothetical protein